MGETREHGMDSGSGSTRMDGYLGRGTTGWHGCGRGRTRGVNRGGTEAVQQSTHNPKRREMGAKQSLGRGRQAKSKGGRLARFWEERIFLSDYQKRSGDGEESMGHRASWSERCG